MAYRNLEKKRVLVTGATGLIGQALVKKFTDLNATVYAAVRNIEKARKQFKDIYGIEFIVSDVTEMPVTDLGLDYIIHAAANTSSKAFVNQPIDIIKTNILGTVNALEMAKINNIDKFVYLSTMEIYGNPTTDEKINESHSSNLDTMSVRSSYPESKRLCECLCMSYMQQYGVPVNVIRLTQTIGPGVQYNDQRVFAEFARCAIEKRNIILHTAGETRRSYLYIRDAIEAIITVLMDGKPGEAYNAANEATYCSILEMANIVAAECSEGDVSVIIDDQGSGAQFGYAPTLRMNLDTSKLQGLGWHAELGLEDAFTELINDMRLQKIYHCV